MTEETDYYADLEIEKTASPDDIKTAFKKLSFASHPDRHRSKSADEQKAIADKFKRVRAANDVLSDPIKRATYDRYGHKGLANIKDTGASTPPSSYTPPPVRRVTAEDTMAFFDSRTADDAGTTSATPTDDGAAQRRGRAAEERRKAREARLQGNSSPSPSGAFQDVAEKVGQATERLKDADAALPLDVLESFRDTLQAFAKEVDTAIERARAKRGPQP